MIYGYARVSTLGQKKNGNSLEEQEKVLIENGCQEIVKESFTGKTVHRPELEKLLNKLQSGDTLIVTKLDRLARNVQEGIEVIKELFKRGIKVYVLNVGLLENTPMGNFFITTLLAVAELERSMIIERMQAGKEIARTKNGYREGKPPVPKEKVKHGLDLLQQGNTYKEVCNILGISKSTLIRAKRKVKAGCF